jgi:Holliday junction resolvasome RuvABC endonuclease subunit
MIIALMDPSFTEFGLVILDSETKTLLCAETISCPKQKTPSNDEVRLRAIIEWITARLLQHKVELVVREEVVGSKSATANRLLNMLKGAIISLCVTRGLDCMSITASQAKKSTSGDRSATKTQIVEQIFQSFPELQEKKLTKSQREAICDALALYIAWCKL